jgi:pyruvate dehydrogenase E1 component alpha subunit
MVKRSRLRALMIPLSLYAVSASVGAFFVWHAVHGDRGLRVKNEHQAEIQALRKELADLKTERERWTKRVALVLSRDAADPPLRGKGRPAVRHGPDRRLLPPLHRPGSGRRRHADGGEEGDQLITSYRDHGHMLACGMDPKGVMAELTGRRGGLSKGKGGSMHMFSKREAFLRRPRHRRRAGAARRRPRLRQRLSRQRQCLDDLFRRRRRQPGPGLRELQHGFAVEAAGHLRHREQPLRHGHGGRARLGADRISPSAACRSTFPASRSTAWTCAPCKAAGEKALEWCRAGKGPYILEMQTYRYRGHSMSDPAKYRTKEEVQKMRDEHDPIEQVRASAAQGVAGVSEDDLKRSTPRSRRSSPRPPISPRTALSPPVRALDRHY